MAKHSKKNKNSKKAFLVLILSLSCIVFGIINFSQNPIQLLNKMSFSQNMPETKEEHEISKSNIRPLYNATYLHSHSFSLTVVEGITTINATITNNSAESVKDLECLYSLMDSSNNIIYSFDISINSIDANSSSSFACMAILDLSNVVDYSVSLIEQ